MGSTLETVVFYFLASFIISMSIMTVTTQRIVRSATYLLFVLFGTAGIYFLLGYTFLGSVQIMVYAGGIVVLYVFSILLTSGEGARAEKLKRSRFLAGLFTMVAGLAIILFITLKHNFLQTTNLVPLEINIHTGMLIIDIYPCSLHMEMVFLMHTVLISDFTSGYSSFTKSYSLEFIPADPIYGGFVTTVSYFCASVSAVCTNGSNPLSAAPREI